MSPAIILTILITYLVILMVIAKITNKNADNASYFIGNKASRWYVVAFGMIGASLSGVTFISVPGWVGTSQFSYMQMVLGYLIGYFIIATVLMPLYYRLNLISIYGYLDQRFGTCTYKTGSFYFLLSRTIGASFRLYIVVNVLQLAVFDKLNVPFVVTIILTIILIWLYTFKGGIKTIVWTDTLQTFFMLLCLVMSIYLIGKELNWGAIELIKQIKNSNYSQTFFWEWKDDKFFVKQFLSGVFIAIVMTGLDQDMMQKNLSCKNIKDAQKNMFWFSITLAFVNLMFLTLGCLLYLYANANSIELPANTDNLYPILALNHFPLILSFTFIIGLIAMAYSSVDSTLTALTTSFCFDFLNIAKKDDKQISKTKFKVHILFSILMILVILVFKAVNNNNVITAIFNMASYTYGPLLGLYAFGLFTKFPIKDKLSPVVCVISPLLCYLINKYSVDFLFGYKFGFELLIVNGLLTFSGLFLLRKKKA